MKYFAFLSNLMHAFLFILDLEAPMYGVMLIEHCHWSL